MRNIILCGDFNGTLDDFVHDMDKITFPIPALKHVNACGKSLAELCYGNEMIVLNGRTKRDYIGQFTCHTYNEASIVDYTIVYADILQSIGYFTVSNFTEFSHHHFALEVEPRLGESKTETVQWLPLANYICLEQGVKKCSL